MGAGGGAYAASAGAAISEGGGGDWYEAVGFAASGGGIDAGAAEGGAGAFVTIIDSSAVRIVFGAAVSHASAKTAMTARVAIKGMSLGRLRLSIRIVPRFV